MNAAMFNRPIIDGTIQKSINRVLLFPADSRGHHPCIIKRIPNSLHFRIEFTPLYARINLVTVPRFAAVSRMNLQWTLHTISFEAAAYSAGKSQNHLNYYIFDHSLHAAQWSETSEKLAKSRKMKIIVMCLGP